MNFEPVCGSDGETYPIECDLKQVACFRKIIEPVTVAFVGECYPTVAPCQLECPRSLVPVCGSDGKTYHTGCDLERFNCVRKSIEKLTVAYVGECKPECDNVACQMNHIPVCSTEGLTYTNDCHLRRAECREGRSIEIAHGGSCN